MKSVMVEVRQKEKEKEMHYSMVCIHRLSRVNKVMQGLRDLFIMQLSFTRKKMLDKKLKAIIYLSQHVQKFTDVKVPETECPTVYFFAQANSRDKVNMLIC